ncbi:MAG TPA: hypothetical protein VGZ27_06505 [Vicinamibacterales bacterium]|jgi:hypothetical protein|nr:hypothetical protein [Vicinamibacterales bacterium]
MLNHRTMLTACGAVLLGVLVTVSVKAWADDRHTTYVTINSPFALPGVALGPGSYVFELADPQMSHSLVRVMSRDRSHVYLTAFTILVQRPAGAASDRVITFAEVPNGITPPVKAWYPIGDSIGHQFIYPKNSRQLTGAPGN